jgi:hypothetical protein
MSSIMNERICETTGEGDVHRLSELKQSRLGEIGSLTASFSGQAVGRFLPDDVDDGLIRETRVRCHRRT